MIRESFGLSIRRSCSIMAIARSSFTYVPIKKLDEDTIRNRLKELAQVRRRFGYRRLHTLLRREGITINHKRVLRLYRLENLSIRIRRRKKLAAVARVDLPQAAKPNQRWSMDFMSDALSDGRKIKVLPIADDYTHKCHAIEVDTSINGRRVCEVLNRIAYKEGLPEVITIDNGPEFIGKALDSWAYQRGVHLRFIRPGKPVENAYIESFNGKFRDECLNEHWFTSPDRARQVIEAWRVDYNNERPHSSLNDMTPEEFLRQETALSEANNSHL